MIRENLFELPEDCIAAATVLMTITNGQIAFEGNLRRSGSGLGVKGESVGSCDSGQLGAVSCRHLVARPRWASYQRPARVLAIWLAG